jgi:hypothetical protein
MVQILQRIGSVCGAVNGKVRETQGDAIEIAEHLVVHDQEDERASMHRAPTSDVFNIYSIGGMVSLYKPLSIISLGLNSRVG